jgi:glucosamine-6-phosphate deaminase
MLNFTLTDNYEEMSALAAKRVAKALERKPDLVMALPTGGTPVGLLQEMSRMAQDNKRIFRVRIRSILMNTSR